MSMRCIGRAILVTLIGGLPAFAAAEPQAPARAALEAVLAGPHRSEANRARDLYRHPLDTLLFFGIRPDMTVVELAPGGGGWYAEILAPFLREHGAYYAAGYDPESKSDYLRENARRLTDKFAAEPKLYERARVTVFAPPEHLDLGPPGSADLVLTFRNLHNWMSDGQAETVLRAAFHALKPGGVLGLVEHRGNPAVAQDPKAESGYVNEAYAIQLAERVGFELEARSEINANPKDTKDHPNGVWSLPPTLDGGEQDRARFLEIGESDRMTLKFVKPPTEKK